MAFFGRSAPPPSRLEELKRALLKDPGSRQFLAVAEEFRKEGEFAEAIQALEKGLRFHPGYVAAHVALGRVCRETGRPDEALKAFLNALKIDRENLVAIKQAAILYAEKGDRVEAVKKLKLYRGLNPGDKEVTEQIERLDMELGTTSRLRQSFHPAGLPLPQREPSTRPFFTPPPAPNPPPAQTEPFPAVSLEPLLAASGAEPIPRVPDILELTYDALPKVVTSDRDGANRPKTPEPDVFLFEVELPVEDEDRTVPGGPVPGSASERGLGAVPGWASAVSGIPAVGQRGERRGDMVTETLADLYSAQGLRTEARNAFGILARTEADQDRAAAFRSRAQAIADEEAAEAAAAAARAANPRRERLEAYLRLVGRPPPGSGDLSPIVEEMLNAGAGIETAIVTETGGVTVVTAGPFGPAEESLAAELADFWKNLQRGSDDVEAGHPSSVSLVAGAGNAVVSGIGDDYALVLRIAAGASMGRVRYEAARTASRLRPLLA